MSLDALFSASNSAALVGWVVLALAPARRSVVRLLVPGIAVVLAMVYVALIASFWTQGTGDFGSLTGVASLFGHRGLLLAGWVHYLAFDLLVGLWEQQEASRLGLSRWLLLPCLLLTLLFGPIGWSAFLALRYFKLRTARPHPTPTPA